MPWLTEGSGSLILAPSGCASLVTVYHSIFEGDLNWKAYCTRRGGGIFYLD